MSKCSAYWPTAAAHGGCALFCSASRCPPAHSLSPRPQEVSACVRRDMSDVCSRHSVCCAFPKLATNCTVCRFTRSCGSSRRKLARALPTTIASLHPVLTLASKLSGWLTLTSPSRPQIVKTFYRPDVQLLRQRMPLGQKPSHINLEEESVRFPVEAKLA